MEITAERFIQATGFEPENDDLERCNCPDVGKIGHRFCGWCFLHNQPVFNCGCEVVRNDDGTYKTMNLFL